MSEPTGDLQALREALERIDQDTIPHLLVAARRVKAVGELAGPTLAVASDDNDIEDSEVRGYIAASSAHRERNLRGGAR